MGINVSNLLSVVIARFGLFFISLVQLHSLLAPLQSILHLLVLENPLLGSVDTGKSNIQILSYLYPVTKPTYGAVCLVTVLWSMLGHVLSKEQSKDGSDIVSDHGCLTIVQCHHYHWPPSSDLYRSSIRILPPI